MSEHRIFWVRPLSRNRFSITCKEPAEGMKKVFKYFPVTTNLGLEEYVDSMKKLEERFKDPTTESAPTYLRGTFNGN